MRKNLFNRMLILIIIVLISSCSKKADEPTDMIISKTSTKALIRTAYGNLEITFYATKAPNTVARIRALISTGFYNGMAFHRVLPGTLIQVGDPTGKGVGGSGISFEIEKNDLKHFKGSSGMAKLSTSNFVDSQFYICIDDLKELDGDHFVFARISKGLNLLDKIQLGDKIITATLIK